MQTRPELPSLFLSHGSPMLAIEDSPAARFLDRLGPVLEATFGRPEAIVMVSPHTATRVPMVSSAVRYGAIHDFGGFPAELYRQRYDAPGSPVRSAEVLALLQAAGIPATLEAAEGVDHGIWTPLKRLWPGAEVPLVPLSLVPFASPAQQWAIGEALAPLRARGVLVIGSGSFTHNLQRYFTTVRAAGRVTDHGADVLPDVSAFQQWVADRVAARDWPALWDYRRQAPGAVAHHPTDEHWLPFYVAAGAGGHEVAGRRLHDSVDGGVLAMDAYAFGATAADLARALQSPS
ncbi:4,5-DOPA dioxygenase extradiol [Sphaerotilus hippei]|uniref:4,5-DOPA dioxygenase extradiol n=1 Tax=Sphaerotilus hippei TaxID=744406 RepID=A0A318H0G6_9BURK|nr:class III extradiol ring-cleavage dioxygenase [Sphaerotilus hippei]PXW96170.1 4,5-DOPA dioxygenase extradiol [Sphaerotilus hippei]